MREERAEGELVILFSRRLKQYGKERLCPRPHISAHQEKALSRLPDTNVRYSKAPGLRVRSWQEQWVGSDRHQQGGHEVGFALVRLVLLEGGTQCLNATN